MKQEPYYLTLENWQDILSGRMDWFSRLYDSEVANLPQRRKEAILRHAAHLCNALDLSIDPVFGDGTGKPRYKHVPLYLNEQDPS
jgi:hypothetical protein